MRPPFRIALFDSGGGGFSILQCLLQKGIAGDYFYYADDALLPYGRLTDAQILRRVTHDFRSHFAHLEPDLLVIACNTASTIVLPGLREAVEFPVVGVVPAIKPAALRSKSRQIALLATPATIGRPYIDQLIAEFAADCHVVRVAADSLVSAAEHYLTGKAPRDSELDALLGEVVDQAPLVDQIVLGCTHFPLLRKELLTALKRIARPDIALIDSGPAIASRVAYLLGEFGLREFETLPSDVADADYRSTIQIFFTGSELPATWEQKCYRACEDTRVTLSDITAQRILTGAV